MIWSMRISAPVLALATLGLVQAPGPAIAQANLDDRAESGAVFVEQAPRTQARPESGAEQVRDASSKVYFPDEITPESVARARAAAARQDQLVRENARENAVAQVSQGEGARVVDQLSDGDSARALAQLSEGERQVLLEAVEGTDICDQASNIPAIKALCDGRIETRSAEFARPRGASAEDRILGGGLDSDRVATLEAAINRLAGNDRDSSNFSNQVIASVALSNPSLGEAAATDEEGDGAEDLSQETQALVAAIVQQLGGN
ncbi:hypothetical protein [Qipengyuania nanhaisediminis]|uniref:hypothetical protein n=1 Tax=Qipengyuania nanhaisediminis TaxID=604088 RepID=UPI0038B40041